MRRALLLAAALIALAAPTAAQATAGLPPIRHVFVIVLENKSFSATFAKSSPAPYLSQTLPDYGALVPNYYGVTHLSLGNYIAMVSGQGSNPTTQDDCQIYLDLIPGTIGADGQATGAGCVYPAAVKTIADQLSAAGLTWKGYMEDMGNASGQAQTCRHPTPGTHDSTQSARVGDQYAVRHNPFAYFHSLLDSGACAKYDVPLSQLPADLASTASTPNLSFITPNLCNDGHDSPCVDGSPGGLVSANTFLQKWVPIITSSPAYRADGLLVITFDEAGGSDASSCCGEVPFPNTPNNGGPYPGMGGGQTGTVLLSPFIDPGTVDTDPLNHFGLLRSFEDIFGLGHLGYAGLAGVPTLGPDAFTCYAPGTPIASHGTLPPGSEIKTAVIGQGTDPKPSIQVRLWHPGQIKVQVVVPSVQHRKHRKHRPRRHHHHGAAVRAKHRRSHHHKHRRHKRRAPKLRTVGTASGTACQPLSVTLPYQHGTAILTASAFGATERRTLSF